MKLKKDKRKDHGTVDEPSSEQQFCKLDAITFLVGKNWSHIALVLPGLMAGWLVDEIVLNLEIFKIIYWMKYLSFCYVKQRLRCYYRHTNAF